MLDRRQGSYAGIDGSVHTYNDPSSVEYRQFFKFFTALPQGRFDWLQYPTNPDKSVTDSIVWNNRWGIGNQ